MIFLYAIIDFLGDYSVYRDTQLQRIENVLDLWNLL